MDLENKIEFCRKCKEQYALETYHCESLRQYLARKMELSIQQTARYEYFFYCIPDIQKMIIQGEIAMSCTDQIGYKDNETQKAIYVILKKALAENVYLARDRIIVPVAQMIEENLLITWDEIKPSLNLLEKKHVRKIARNRIKDCSHDKGERFVNVLVEGMRNSKSFSFIKANPKRSKDYKCDIEATTHEGRDIVIQCKYHKLGTNEGERAVREAEEARLNYNANIAIAVTSTSFTLKAKQVAKELNVVLWDGNYLRDFFAWDGGI